MKHAGATVFRQELEYKCTPLLRSSANTLTDQCFEYLEAAKEGNLTHLRANSGNGVLDFVHPKVVALGLINTYACRLTTPRSTKPLKPISSRCVYTRKYLRI